MSVRSNGHAVSNGNDGNATETPVRVRKASEIQAKKLSWLLPGRISATGLTLVEGQTHAGKSTFLAHLVASVTTGRAWCGRAKTEPRNVFWCSGEEDFGSMVSPRLKAAGADLNRVLSPDVDDHDEPIRYQLPHCVSTFRRLISEHGIVMVVLEPLSSFVGPECDLNSVTATRNVLDPLQRLSFAAGCSVILTRGIRKDRTGPRSSHGQGSSAIGDTARNALQIDAVDQHKGTRVLVAWKVQGGRLAPPLSYELESGEGGPVMSNLRELSAIESLDADTATDSGTRTERSDARDLLRVLLKDGWLRVKVLFQAAADAGISLATLRKASAELSVVRRQKWENEVNLWEWGPPEGGFAHQTPPPVKTVHQGIRVRKPRKKAQKSSTLIP